MGEARPSPEEFSEARRRELSRLNVRITSTIGHKRHTHEDEELLVGDSAKRRWADMATVRRWSEHAPRQPGTRRTSAARPRNFGRRASQKYVT